MNGRYAAIGTYAPTHQDVYLYDIQRGTSRVIPRPGGVSWQYNPAVASDGTTYYVRSGNGCGANARIMQTAPDGETIELAKMPDLVDVGFMYAFDQANGWRILYFNRLKCRSRTEYAPNAWDIFALLFPAGLAEGSRSAIPHVGGPIGGRVGRQAHVASCGRSPGDAAQAGCWKRWAQR